MIMSSSKWNVKNGEGLKQKTVYFDEGEWEKPEKIFAEKFKFPVDK